MTLVRYPTTASSLPGSSSTTRSHQVLRRLCVAPSCSYRPISNLDFISRILERLFFARFQPHILACSNFNNHQSAYRPRHSTETSLLSTLDTIYRAFDIGSSTLLVSVDLSAAFDTIDHVTLINRLRTSFGITGSVLSWLQSYLSNRTQSVCIGHHSSTPTRCTTGVPQGLSLIHI